MDLLYWITRLDEFNTLFGIFEWVAIILAIVAVAWLIGAYSAKNELINDNRDPEDKWTDKFKARVNEKNKLIKFLRKCAISFTSVWVVVLLLDVFLPSTNEAYAIYGVGSTIDYCRSNEKLKELPDKAVEALDLFADRMLDDLKKDGVEPEKTETPNDAAPADTTQSD